MKYIQAFNEIETQIISIPTDQMSVLKLMFNATEQTKEEVENVKSRVSI